MRPAPTRLPLLQCTKAARLPASSRTASTSRLNVASLTAPCPTGMLRYSRPAWTTASGVLNGRGSIASRRSITTAHPARFSAARCSGAGCPPVTIPGIGSQALGMPVMASRSWLMGIAGANFPRSIYLVPLGMASTRRPSLRAHLKPHHKLWLDWDGAFLMGPRYLHFLDAVDRTGTIRAAGREVGWSYRTCLNRIREMERVLGAKVLATTRGGSSRGGARLTPQARRLVKLFARWRREVERLSLTAFRKLLRR